MIYCKRVYEAAEREDGYRVFVDRLWPRGVSKGELIYDEWAKDLAPSGELRKAFHSEAIDFAEFSRCYVKELEAQSAAAHALAARAGERPVTLLYAAKNTEQNHALVLADFLRGLSG